VSIQLTPARDFRPLESCHFVSILRYLIHFSSLCSFVDCRFRVRVSIRMRVSVSFIFSCIFPFQCMLKKQKLPPGRLPPWLSMFRLHCIGRKFRKMAVTAFQWPKIPCWCCLDTAYIGYLLDILKVRYSEGSLFQRLPTVGLVGLEVGNLLNNEPLEYRPITLY